MRNIFKILNICTIVSGSVLSGLYAMPGKRCMSPDAWDANVAAWSEQVKKNMSINDSIDSDGDEIILVNHKGHMMNKNSSNPESVNDNSLKQGGSVKKKDVSDKKIERETSESRTLSDEESESDVSESRTLSDEESESDVSEDGILSEEEPESDVSEDGILSEEEPESDVSEDGILSEEESESESINLKVNNGKENSVEVKLVTSPKEADKKKVEIMSSEEYNKKLEEKLEPLLKFYKEERHNDVRKAVLDIVSKMIYTDHKTFYQGAVVSMDKQTWEFFSKNESKQLGGCENKKICELELTLIEEQTNELIKEIAAKLEAKKAEKAQKEQEKAKKKAKQEARKRQREKMKAKVDEQIKAKNKIFSAIVNNLRNGITPVQRQQVSPQNQNSLNSMLFGKK